MKIERYSLKENVEVIFKEILTEISKFVKIKKIFKSANDYSSYIILNPNISPEILFEEEYEKEISEFKEKNFAVYGNLEFGEKNLHYLKIFLDGQLIYQIYGYEDFDKKIFSLNAKYSETQIENELKKSVENVIKNVIMKHTLFQ